MEISANKQSGGVLLTVVGRLDTSNAAQFETACDPWIRGGEKNIVADLSRLEYISSMGLGYLLTITKRLQSAGGKLVVCGLNGMVKQVFGLAGLDKLIPGFENSESAFRAL